MRFIHSTSAYASAPFLPKAPLLLGPLALAFPPHATVAAALAYSYFLSHHGDGKARPRRLFEGVGSTHTLKLSH